MTRVLCVTNKKLWVIVGVVAAGSLAAVPGLTAQAYPPGTGLTIDAAATGTDGVYSVTLANGKSGCGYEIESRGVKKSGTFPAADPILLPVGTKPGTYVFNVHTVGCAPSENATKKILVTHAKASGPSNAQSGDKIKLNGSGWSPDDAMVFTLTNGKGATISSPKLKPNADGDVTYTLTAPAAGLWAVVATQEGSAPQSFNLAITTKIKTAPKPKPKPKPHHKPKPKPKPHHKAKPKPKVHHKPKPKPKGH